jgi:hypothetical protein
MNQQLFRVGLATASVIALLSRVPAAAQTAPPPAKAGTAQAAKSWTPPRTPWGEPDLQGTYSNKTITPFERPANVGGREFYTREEVEALQKRAQCARHRGRFPGELAPREAHDPEAGDEEVRVASAVGFERAAGAVRAPAVRFGHEALAAPEEVDFVNGPVGLGAGVDGGAGKASIQAQREKAFLELAPGDLVGSALADEPPQVSCSLTAAAASERPLDCADIEEAEHLGPAPGALDRRPVDDGTEVRKRSRDRRAGDPVLLG